MTSCFRLLNVCDIKLKICINVDIVFHSYKTLVILAPVRKPKNTKLWFIIDLLKNNENFLLFCVGGCGNNVHRKHNHLKSINEN